MAKCEVCGREMLTAKGCSASKVFVAGKAYSRIKCGDIRDFNADLSDGERCSDCGAVAGHYHHWGCDCERCPTCGGQLISCSCEDVYIQV